jgi:3-deoxy-D-manno-octulosonate 8-phosphate phosphatase KdsC-like HAD superfamily phosphatase
VPQRSPNISPALKKRAKQIKVLLMDVDGTITNGGVTLLSRSTRTTAKA